MLSIWKVLVFLAHSTLQNVLLVSFWASPASSGRHKNWCTFLLLTRLSADVVNRIGFNSSNQLFRAGKERKKQMASVEVVSFIISEKQKYAWTANQTWNLSRRCQQNDHEVRLSVLLVSTEHTLPTNEPLTCARLWSGYFRTNDFGEMILDNYFFLPFCYLKQTYAHCDIKNVNCFTTSNILQYFVDPDLDL